MKLRDVVEKYLSYRRSLGEKCTTKTHILNQYCSYMGNDFDFSGITEYMNMQYLYMKGNTVTPGWFVKFSALKGLFQWAYPRNYISAIPLPVDLPKNPGCNSPYVYTHEELKKLFYISETFKTNASCKLYNRCISTFLKLTYVLALRPHETISLKMKDLNMEENYVLINESKFFKSRRVSFNQQVKTFLEDYIEWRKSVSMPSQEEASLFYNKDGKAETISRMRYYFFKIRSLSGIKRTDKCFYQPRIHDLRGTFAVHRLTAWYKEGLNVNELLPYLSTFMGHDRLVHTQVYLTITEDLFYEANRKFEEYVKN